MITQQLKSSFSPFLISKERTSIIMLDVICSLLAPIAFAIMYAGTNALTVFVVAITSAVLTELIFVRLYLKKSTTLLDGSAIITAILLSLTLSPFTPWYVVAFGSFGAILFGKILWGGLGKNQFNPALTGREMMTAFFPLIMGSGALWSITSADHLTEIRFFTLFGENDLLIYFDRLLYKTSGAMGEYSIIFLILGGLYLLIRRRISWHIPVSILVCFFVLSNLVLPANITYPIASLFLGAIYMATDMPSSPNTRPGKIFYGMVIAATAIFCIKSGVKNEFMSYSILIGNAFKTKIDEAFTPAAWGQKTEWGPKTEQIVILIILISAVGIALIQCNHLGITHYLIGIYIALMIFKFNKSAILKSNHQTIKPA